MTILRLIWPFLERYLAKSAAEYLRARRERRLQRQAEESTQPELSAAEESGEVAQSGGLLANNPLWYTLAGMLLGSALTVILDRLSGPDESVL